MVKHPARHGHTRRDNDDDDENENTNTAPVQQDTTPTPAVNPTAPVGPVRTGSTGIDQAGNIWYIGIGGTGLTFLATTTLPLPASED